MAINLEGSVKSGTWQHKYPNLENHPTMDTYTLKFIKGRTYYFNQIQVSNYDASDRYNLKFEPL